jgi:signal transduction histidine kinase
MLRIEIFRTRAVRFTFAFCLAVSIATAVAFGFIYLRISRVEIQGAANLLEDEAAGSVADPISRLREAFEPRLTRDIRRLDYVALFSENGTKVLGNIPMLPPIPVDGHAHIVSASPASYPGTNEPAIFIARERPDGVLVLGRSLRELYDLQRTVLEALALALVPTVLTIMLIGVFFARRAMQRFEHIHSAIVRIMNGELDLRLPVTDERDEIDKVARAVNLMLDEIAVLLDQLKSVGDNIAHDLRTPLMASRSRLERALNDGSDADALRATMQAALSQLDRASLTISAILRISSVENDTRKKPFTDLDLSAICTQVFDLYEPLAESKLIVFAVDAVQPVVVRGDEDLMREAIANLVDNALKFTPAGGRVGIEAGMADNAPFVRVSDTGCGVAAEERDKVFVRFYRNSRHQGDGNGLGLSIASTIAKLHGFELTVEDNHPGARFEMRAAAKASLALEACGSST